MSHLARVRTKHRPNVPDGAAALHRAKCDAPDRRRPAYVVVVEIIE